VQIGWGRHGLAVTPRADRLKRSFVREAHIAGAPQPT